MNSAAVPTTSPVQLAPETFLIPNLADGGDGTYVPVNSLLIRGREPIVVDTGAPVHRQQWLDKVYSLVDPQDIRWVFLSHEDGDHTGGLADVLTGAPNATLVLNMFGTERSRANRRHCSRSRSRLTRTHRTMTTTICRTLTALMLTATATSAATTSTADVDRHPRVHRPLRGPRHDPAPAGGTDGFFEIRLAARRHRQRRRHRHVTTRSAASCRPDRRARHTPCSPTRPKATALQTPSAAPAPRVMASRNSTGSKSRPSPSR
jgi:hypothetical protein